MKIIIGCTVENKEYANSIIPFLKDEGISYEIIENTDVIKTSLKVSELVLEAPSENRGIIVDDYGIAPFLVTGKIKGIICAELNDEHSALMTRDHNNANIISIGSQVVGKGVAKSIMKRFIISDYAGGRHQIRIDMLNDMGGIVK